MRTTTLIAASVALFAAACGEPREGYADLAAAGMAEQALDRYGLLGFVNDPATDLDVLDAHCGLRSDAAQNIMYHRDGKDGEYGTQDDNYFETVAELEGVYRVGPFALEQLYFCAESAGYLFADELGMLAFVNDTTVATFHNLDVICGIRSDSARNIVTWRDGRDTVVGSIDDNPFDSITEIDNVFFVGIWTLGRLYNCADTFGFLTKEAVTAP